MQCWLNNLSLSFAFLKFICIFAIITNIYQYETHDSLYLEFLYRRVQKYDLGPTFVDIDSLKDYHTLFGVETFLLSTRAEWQER